MARTNKKAQSDRSKSGARLEGAVRLLLEQLLEKSPKLDKAFRVAEKPERKILLRYDGASEDYPWLPDFMVIHIATNAVVLIGGAKTSLRERYPVDALPWDYCRRKYAGGLLYFQVTVSEKESDTLEQIRQFMHAKRARFGDLLPLLFSTKDPDSENEAKRVIAKHLHRILALQDKDLGADKFPRPCYAVPPNKSISRSKSKPDEEQPALLFK